MSLNSQHKRVSKNRVSITYDVETNGAVETKELPFVIGVIGDYSGHKDAAQKIAPEKREFMGIDKDNFDAVMSQVGPELTYKVENKLAQDGSEFEVNLKFDTIKDFHPENLIQQIEPLKNLLETRNQLKTLLSKADRSSDLEKLLKEILQNSAAIEQLASELGINKEAE
nr:type VI secretion system contractile sheath small subunit [uncultured Moellerella sp.]